MGWGPFTIEGKRVIVTGGAMGIGRGIVERFVEGGADVLIADLDEDRARDLAEKLAGSPGRVASVGVDVATPAAGERLVAACLESFGGVDVLVNNAGIYPMVPMLETSPELWDRVQAINLRGLAFISQAVAKRFIVDGRGGVIVNIGSIDSVHPSRIGLAAYDASKGGVAMFTKNFALEMARHGVRVNAILPGGIATEGTAAPLEGSGLTPEQMERMVEEFVARIPLRRMGESDDVATVAVFLASSASAYMTGELVVVDGGALLT
jgi:2-deoxy-D-gluconate 3-dehydrogenase